ncbi:Nitrite and sulphite reductase 4Fe-4S domain-containing protein [Gracilibacillus ureilyticus]|uniref:Nitrite and sulphite reductase 4Fe-4S domain-containing protein n=1 Tax=Gracilibacillus ureilyticus TaxID=531814 RepID=A0A1H9TZI0_9BACI|nr:nitrite reductase [Gracilibacillus ureilyticus]SES02810.1 Nitrite and sulphite reductase 4Fe-4S domain-containing protein [Gracilibacillus ureilyticus]
METDVPKIKIAVNGGIGFGAKLNAKQLVTISKYMNEEDELELTTFQQLYLEIPEHRKDEIIEELESVGLACYPVGNVVKSLRTCNFCKGEEREGMPIAKELNRRFAGKPVPFTLKMAYTGCAVGCGEPMLSDIGVMKFKDRYNLYIGGKAKGKDAEVGYLLKEGLTPEELYDTVDKLIAAYAEMGKKREAFYKFCKRVDIDQLNENKIM